MSIGELRRHLAAAVNRAGFKKNRIVVQRNGRPVAAIIPLDDLERLEAFEDALDARLADEAAAENGAISLEEFRRELDR